MKRGLLFGMAAVVAGMVLCAASPASAGTVSITITATADNYYDVYVDGGLSLSGVLNVSAWTTAEVGSASTASGGLHCVAVKGCNHVPWPGYNPAGFLAQLDAGAGSTFAETGTQLLLTDSAWKYWYGGPPGTPPVDGNGLNWYDVGYDDSGWSAAYSIGPNDGTTYPWGPIIGGPIAGISPQAEWIWSPNWDDNGLPIGGQDVDSPVYFRRCFTPIPEPMTGLLCVMGMAGVAGYLRKRRLA